MKGQLWINNMHARQCQMAMSLVYADFNLKQRNSFDQIDVLGGNMQDSLDTDSLPNEVDINRRVEAQNHHIMFHFSSCKLDLMVH